MTLQVILFSILGYFSGSVLYASWIPHTFGHMDVRELSSDGNPGTANVFSVCGPKYGVPAGILEFAKGFVPVTAAWFILDPREMGMFYVPIILAPVIGHMFSIFNHFRGGVGIAATFGTLIAVFFGTRLLILLVIIYSLAKWCFRIKNRHKRTTVVFTAFLIGTLILETNSVYRMAYSLLSTLILVKNQGLKRRAGNLNKVTLEYE